jgi:hypothetical protein
MGIPGNLVWQGVGIIGCLIRGGVMDLFAVAASAVQVLLPGGRKWATQGLTPV